MTGLPQSISSPSIEEGFKEATANSLAFVPQSATAAKGIAKFGSVAPCLSTYRTKQRIDS
jgi:hypothetical protein